MTFQQIWSQLVKKRPELAKPETVVEFKAENLEQLLRQVYEQGQKSVKVDPPSDNPFSSIFGL